MRPERASVSRKNEIGIVRDVGVAVVERRAARPVLQVAGPHGDGVGRQSVGGSAQRVDVRLAEGVGGVLEGGLNRCFS